MLKNLIFTLFIYLLIFTEIHAQSKFAPSFGVGITKRLFSMRLNDLTTTGNKYELFTYNIGMSQTYLSIDVKHNIFKNKFILELSNYFTYSEFRQVRPDLYSRNYTSEYRFKHDHFLSILHPFKSKKKRPQFVLGAGVGIINLGTDFKYDIFKGFDSSNNLIVVKDNKGCFSFFAPKLIFGLQKNRLNGYLIVNSTRDEMYEKNPTIQLEFKATYTFKPFTKKKD